MLHRMTLRTWPWRCAISPSSTNPQAASSGLTGLVWQLTTQCLLVVNKIALFFELEVFVPFLNWKSFSRSCFHCCCCQ